MSLRVIVPDEKDADARSGGVHNRPPIPDGTAKSECPKFMSHGPCGGVRKGGFCEVYPDMTCPWVTLYFELEKIGQIEWMKQV
jgi:hypothetical protein